MRIPGLRRRGVDYFGVGFFMDYFNPHRQPGAPVFPFL